MPSDPVTDIVIVAKTRMGEQTVCVGAHRLSDFRSLRLHLESGNNFPSSTLLEVGQTWSARLSFDRLRKAPHVEDVTVSQLEQGERIPDLARLLRSSAHVWIGPPDALFGGHLEASERGSGFVPSGPRQPLMSTGYWLPPSPLERDDYDGKARFRYIGTSRIFRTKWVGVADPPQLVPAGTLVRVSLSRPFKGGRVPERGCWLQLSGVYSS